MATKTQRLINQVKKSTPKIAQGLDPIGDFVIPNHSGEFQGVDVKNKPITLTGKAKVRKHIHLLVDSFLPGVASPTANTIGHYSGYNYSNVVTQTATTDFHVPEDWDGETDMLIHLHWAPLDATAGNVVWDVDYRVTQADNGEILSGTDRSLTVTDGTNSLQYEHLKTADMTIPASDLNELDIIGICLSRDTADGADTYGAAAFAFFLEILYVADKLGEAT